MAATFTPIASVTLGAAASSVVFSSIPGTYTDLICTMEAKSDSSAPDFQLQLNSDTGTNYSSTGLEGNGSTASSARQSTVAQIRLSFGIEASSTNPGIGIIHIMNYANTTTNKTVLARINNASDGTGLTVGLYRSTAAITSVTLKVSSNNFASGSTFNLYGILGANA